MTDFLATSVAYYVLRAKWASAAGPASTSASKSRDHPMHRPFREMLHQAGAFFDECQSVVRKAREQEEAAVLAVLMEYDSEVKGRARDMLKQTEDASAVLLPLIRASKPIPSGMLEALNAGIRAIESHSGAVAGKSDALPDALLTAEPGSKLYPGLAKKLEAICGRSFADCESREVERFQARLLKGGFHKAFDEQRSAIAAAVSEGKQQLYQKYAQRLSDSDHIPVRDTLPFGSCGSIKISTWNVLEFPALRASHPVVDGVRPVCDIFLKYLGQKGADGMSLFLGAMNSDEVINNHTERVVSFIQDELADGCSDILLLQEVGEGVKHRIVELCESKGWSSHFSTQNDDSTKCDAITAIVSKRAFDEVAEFEVQRNNKVRHFAAARFASNWVVSVHLPLSTVAKDKEDLSGSFGSYSMKIIQQLYHRFGNVQESRQVIAGGDWNAAIRNTLKIATANPPEGCSSISSYAPACETTIDDFLADEPCSPIDGFFVLK